MNRRTWTVVLRDGVIPGLMNLCFYLAPARSPLGIAVTIEFLGPLAVVLAGSRRWLDAFCVVVLMAGGMVLLMEGRGDLNLVGFLFTLAAGTCRGLYILVGMALGDTTEGSGLALGMAVAEVVTVPFRVAGSGAALIQPWVLVAGLAVDASTASIACGRT
jgi:inner membrane transporter RhtA